MTFALSAFIENLTLTGTDRIDGTGNPLANTIIGNSEDNQVWGDRGGDKLYGLAGHDTLVGGLKQDTLFGGAGGDVLIGGGVTGSQDTFVGENSQRDVMDGGEDGDFYVVDSADIVRDTGVLNPNQSDIIFALSDYHLRAGDGIESIQQHLSSYSASLWGNELDNQIDSSPYSTGNDLRGFGGSDRITGSGGGDLIKGGSGNDRIQGLEGRDLLYGKGGEDLFVFGMGDSLINMGPRGADIIYDFDRGADQLELDVADSPFMSGYAGVKVNSDSFADIRNAAEDAMNSADVVFVAGATDGWLFSSNYGADRTAEQAIQLKGLNTLSAFAEADLILV